jgi:hypothetical protein
VGVGSVEPSPANDLYPSWYKKPTTGSQQAIDIVSNKLATDCTPSRARQNATNASANTFSGDKFVTGAGRAASNTSEQDDVHKCSDAKPNVTVTVPGNTCNGSCTITATATQGTHPISSDRFKGTINVLIDGQQVQSFTVGTSPATVSFNYTVAVGVGSHRVTAQVIDSVLYDNSDEETVTFGGGAASSISLTSARIQGNRTRFAWSGGNGQASIYNAVTNTKLCGPDSNDCDVDKNLAPLGTPVYAQDTSGTRSVTTNVGP